jgi:hypothetical protein
MSESTKSGLPKSAMSRLREGTVSAHPDANLLTAFTEHALESTEREHVLAHLAQCADCREIVALSVPVQDEQQVGAEARGWFGLRPEFLRWAVVGASATVVVAAVLMVKPELETSPSRQAEVKAPVTDGRAADAVSSAPASKEETAQKQQPDKVQPKRRLAETDQQEVVVSGYAPAATPPPPAPLAGPTGGVVRGLASDSLALRSARGRDMSTGAGQAGAKEETKSEKVKDLAAANPEAEQAVAHQAVSVTEQSRSALQDGDNAKPAASTSTVMADGAAKSKMAREDAGTTVELQAASRNVSRLGMGPGSDRTLRKAFQATERTWRVVEGRLEWSADAGKTWQVVNAKGDVKFLAVDARRESVWAAGTSGVVLRSPDQGVTWVPVANGWTGDVVHLRFKDEKHGLLRTSTKEEWFTEDGGATWKKQ